MTEGISNATAPLVLYVDDERTNCIVFEQSLKAEFSIRCFTDPSEALKFVDDHEVAVVVTDMRMPKITGDQLLNIVKERHPRIVRIVLTAFSDSEPMLRAINDGLAARYIVKPWVREEMIQVLRWGLEAYNFGRDAGELQRRLFETERLATIGRFASMFVHDLGQPLTAAMINASQISEEIVPSLRAALEDAAFDAGALARVTEHVEELDRTVKDVERALRTVRDFQKAMNDFGKPKKPGAPPDTDPLPIVRHAITVCSSLARTSKAQLDYRGPATLPHVRMSATELTQVLINLLSNGTQAVAATGVQNGSVSIEARELGGEELELCVRDQGIGMAPDVLQRVGTPFFTTRAEGTGLGLAQCQRLVGNAGGRLQIDSQPGIGTTVTITLPTAALPTAA